MDLCLLKMIIIIITLFVLTNVGNATTQNETQFEAPNEEDIITIIEEDSRTNISTENVIVDSKRHRRLIPQQKFYLATDLQNQRLQTYASGNSQKFPTLQTYRIVPQRIRIQPSYNIERKPTFPQQQLPTPFTENNKLPGGFTPMLRPQQPSTQSEQIIQQYITEKNPDFSAIYDKLSQYKQLVQQQLTHPSIGYAYAPTPTPSAPFTVAPTTPIPFEHHQHQPQQQRPKIITLYKIRKPVAYIPIQTYSQNPPQKFRIIATAPIVSPSKGIVQNYAPIRDQPQSITENYNTYNNPPIEQTYRPVTVTPEYIENTYRPVASTQSPPIAIENYRPISIKNYPESIKYQYSEPPIRTTSKPIYVPDDRVKQILKLVPLQNTSPQTFPSTEVEEPSVITATPINIAPPKVSVPVKTNTLQHLLTALQYSQTIPQKITPNNIDSSIKTLVNILGAIQAQPPKTQIIFTPAGAIPEITSNKYPQSSQEELNSHEHHHQTAPQPLPIQVQPVKIPQQEIYVPQNEQIHQPQEYSIPSAPHPQVAHSAPFEDESGSITQVFPAQTLDGGTPGRPGIDYPAFSTIPQTSFDCKTQRYKGFFGDPETNCQVWHYCDLNGGQASFLCPNGTIFSQVALTCDWWYNVKCATTPQLYVLNERLYKYILPFTPKFPEDYSGPLVDRYITQKFREQEEEMRKRKKKGKPKIVVNDDITTTSTEQIEKENTLSSIEIQNLDEQMEEIDRKDVLHSEQQQIISTTLSSTS